MSKIELKKILNSPEFENFLGGKSDEIETRSDTRFSEREDVPTPSGGDYMITYFYDKNHRPCHKKEAKFVNTVEYTKEGCRVNETYGIMG